MNHATLTAALIIGLSNTTSTASPQSSQSNQQPNQSTNQSSIELSTQMMAINDAVEATKENPSALTFVIVLPENHQQARDIRDQWTNANQYTKDTNAHIFFVRGTDAQFVLESSYLQNAPATIAFRNGRPYHSRTGTLTDANLRTFLALSLDPTTPITYAPDQTEFLFNSMNKLAQANQDPAAAQAAGQIMLNLHALIQGPYAKTYSPRDLTAMNTLYNQTQLTLSSLDLKDSSVLDQINKTRAIAMKTWNTRTTSTFGIGIWFDLSLASNNTNDILTWIDQGLSNPTQSKRVAQSLQDFGQPLASLLINNNRYQALAMTFTTTDDLKAQLAASTKLANEIAAIQALDNPKQSPAYQRTITRATKEAASYHAALLLVGHDKEAWQVAQITQDFAGPQLASAAICSAVINAGTLQDRHAYLVRNLDQTKHAALINALNTSFAVVPTDN